MDLKKVKAFLFDMDDTIFCSERLNIELIDRFFREKFSLTLDNQDAEYVFGHSWQDIYHFISKKYSLRSDVDTIKEGVLALKRDYLKSHKLEIGDGFRDTLKFPVKKVIVSGSDEEEIEMMLDSAGLEGEFDFWIATRYGKGKPLPDGYQEALGRLDISPEEALVFEDSGSGIESARRAGISSVFVAQFAFHDHSGEADFAFPTFIEFNKFFARK